MATTSALAPAGTVISPTPVSPPVALAPAPRPLASPDELEAAVEKTFTPARGVNDVLSPPSSPPRLQALMPAQTTVARLRAVRDEISSADVTKLIKDSGYTAHTVPQEVRQTLASYLLANIERFSAGAQKTLDTFINPSISTGRELWDGFQVGAIQPASMEQFGYYGITYGRIAKTHPNISDMKQGQDGDCWFDCSSSALAYSGLLKTEKDGSVTVNGKPFITPLPSGFLQVTFQTWNADGSFTPTPVIIDRALPSFGSNSIYDGDANANALWPAYIEKAFAALRGGYAGIDGGWPFDALTAITGWKPSIYSTVNSDSNDLYEKMTAALAAKQPVTADTYDGSLPQMQAAYLATGIPSDGTGETGVVLSHCYTVMKTVEVNGVRYVKLRNPWGFHVPVGDGFSNGRNDGTFWLPYDQFAGVFQFVTTVGPPGTRGEMKTPNDADNFIDNNYVGKGKTIGGKAKTFAPAAKK